MIARALFLVVLSASVAHAEDPRKLIGVPHEVPCPAIARPTGDPLRLAAKTAGIVDPDGFLREDIGIAEAVALLGKPSLCDHEATSAYMDMFLMPKDAGARSIELETKDDALIGIVIEFDPPVGVDVTKLRKKYGRQRFLAAPDDSFEAGGATFDVTTAAFTAQLMFSHRSSQDPETAWKVHQVIYRRSALADSLPEGFHTQADVERLIGLVLRKRAPAPVDFYGTLGVYDKTVGDAISFGKTLPVRNVARAAMEKRSHDGRDFVHAVTVTFKKPIDVAKPAAIKGVTRTIVNGKLTAIAIVRDEP